MSKHRDYQSPKERWRSFLARQRQLKNPVSMKYHEWLEWWLNTGHWHQRGPDPEQYSMMRVDDSQPYSIDNVICVKNRHRNILWHRIKGKYGE